MILSISGPNQDGLFIYQFDGKIVLAGKKFLKQLIKTEEIYLDFITTAWELQGKGVWNVVYHIRDKMFQERYGVRL